MACTCKKILPTVDRSAYGYFAVFIIVPIALTLAAIEHFRHKASERKSGGGGISGFVGGAMLEMDKFVRPSAEHHIAAEKQILKREDDTGGK
jgi:hypothetical protein